MNGRWRLGARCNRKDTPCSAAGAVLGLLLALTWLTPTWAGAGEAPLPPAPLPQPVAVAPTAGSGEQPPETKIAAATKPINASEAQARAEREFQTGQWLEAFYDYSFACRYFAEQAQQARFERNPTQADRAELQALACLGEMAWIYRHYPTPTTALPVVEELSSRLDKEPKLLARAARLLLSIAGDGGHIELQKRLRTEQQYIADWQVLGPIYPETELEPQTEVAIADEPMNTAISPLRLKLRSLDLQTPVVARDRLVQWRRLPDIPLDGRVPIHYLVAPMAGRRALLATWIKAPARQDLPLIFNVNGPMRVYHDFAPVAAFNEGSDGEMVEVGLTLRLHAGWNRLLVELEAPVNRAEADGEIASGRLLAQNPATGWWLACRATSSTKDLIVDAVRDHAIDGRSRPSDEDFTRDLRPWLTPSLPEFPSMPEDTRTWSDVHRDLLIAWMRTAAEAAAGSRVQRAAIVAQGMRFGETMKDDLRFYALLARLTPAGLEGFRFGQPQTVWLEAIETRFPQQSATAAWLMAETRRWPYRDAEGGAQILTQAGAASDITSGYSVREALRGVLEARGRRNVESRRTLELLEQRAESNPGSVPTAVRALLAAQRLEAGKYGLCADTLKRIPPGEPHWAALETAVALYDRWNFGSDRQLAVGRCNAYLAGSPLDPRAWRLKAALHRAQRQWAEAADSLKRAQYLQPENVEGWHLLMQAADQIGDGDLADRSRMEAGRRAPAAAQNWRMPPPNLTLEAMTERIRGIERLVVVDGETSPDENASTQLSRAQLREYEYLSLLEERIDTVSETGDVDIDRNEYIYLRSRRAAQRFQRMTWAAPRSGLTEQIQVRRFRPADSIATVGAAPERSLEGVTTAAADGGVVTRLEDLAAGDVVQIRRLTRIPAARVEASEYAAQIVFGAERPCLYRRFTLVYPAAREVLWRRTGAGLDFSSELDPTYQTARLSWERAWSAADPNATANLRLNFQSPRMSALEWLRCRRPSNIAIGEDMAVLVERLRTTLRGRPKQSEALARALFETVRTQVRETDLGVPLTQLELSPSAACFSRRSGNRWERCELLAALLRAGGLDAYVYAIRTNTSSMPDPRQQVPVLPEDFDDCIVGWHRPFDSIVWLYPQGHEGLEFAQIPAAWSEHPALRLNPRGPVLLERLPRVAPGSVFPTKEAP